MAENEKIDLDWRHSARWKRVVQRFLAGETDGLDREVMRALNQTIKNVAGDLKSKLSISFGDLFVAAATGPEAARQLINGFSDHRDYIDLCIERATSRSPLAAARAFVECVVDRFLCMGIVDHRLPRALSMTEADDAKSTLLQKLEPQFDRLAQSLAAGRVPRFPGESRQQKDARGAALLKQSVLRRTRPIKEDRNAGESPAC